MIANPHNIMLAAILTTWTSLQGADDAGERAFSKWWDASRSSSGPMAWDYVNIQSFDNLFSLGEQAIPILEEKLRVDALPHPIVSYAIEVLKGHLKWTPKPDPPRRHNLLPDEMSDARYSASTKRTAESRFGAWNLRGNSQNIELKAHPRIAGCSSIEYSPNSTQNSASILSQVVPVSAPGDYNFQLKLLVETGKEAFTVDLSVQWFNAEAEKIGEEVTTVATDVGPRNPMLRRTWYSTGISCKITPDATRAKLTVRLSAKAITQENALYIDEPLFYRELP